MTDNEIKKALECCKYDPDTTTCDECMGNLMKDALDLINRLEAEIGDLRAEKVKHFLAYEKDRKRVKSEAVKEFAERLKKDLVYEPFFETDVVFLDKNKINNLVKETAGE